MKSRHGALPFGTREYCSARSFKSRMVVGGDILDTTYFWVNKAVKNTPPIEFSVFQLYRFNENTAITFPVNRDGGKNCNIAIRAVADLVEPMFLNRRLGRFY